MTSTNQKLLQAEYYASYYAANRQQILERRKLRRQGDIVAARAAEQVRRDANRDKLREQYARNRNKSLARSKAYYAANKEQLKAKKKARRQANLVEARAKEAAYRKANPQIARAHYLANKSARHKWAAAYLRRRAEENPSFGVYRRVVRKMNDALAKHLAGRRVTSKSQIVEWLGCEWTEFMSHIERQFAPGMTWSNHGQSGWHFDHIRPLSSFDLTDREQLKQACHFTNVQPLWAADNVRKGAKIP